MRRSRLILTALLVMAVSTIRAQEVIIRAILDTNRALIGDQLKLDLTVEKPAQWQVEFPTLKDSLTHDIEIINVSPIDTSPAASGKVLLRQELLITVFDTGSFEVPSQRFTVKSDKLTDTLASLPVYFEILPVKADSTIRDIKAIYRVPVTFRELYPYILALLLAGILMWFIIRYLKKHPMREIRSSAKISSEPPDVIALRELEVLKEDKPWTHNRVKFYYSRISEILRGYIEGRFNTPALEQTTDEILGSLKSPVDNPSELGQLSEMLKLADLVKFAKVIPDAYESEAQIDKAAGFIRNTSVALTSGTPDNINESTVTESNRPS
jgi:hypothetical protein